MKKLIVIHTAWALLAAGAYLTGTMHRDAGTRAGGDSRHISSGTVSSPRAPGAPETKKESAGPAEWLDSFRTTNGLLSSDRMKEAAQAALREPDPVQAMLHFTTLLRELTAENAPGVLEAVREMGGGSDAARYLSLLAHAWGEKDGRAALAGFDSLHRREGELAGGAALAAWAGQDPDAATKWMQEHRAAKTPADPRRESALNRGLITGLARRDMDAALAYLQTVNESQHGELINVLAEQKLKEGPASAAVWAQNLPGERMRVTGMETVGGQYLRQDLDGAVKWAETIAARADAHEAVADIANEMAGKNPQQAASWVAALPAGKSQNHAFEDVFETWTRKDPLAASQSLTAMTPGPGRDSAIQAFSGILLRENPTDALTWAGAVFNADQRIDLQVDLARRWYAKAPGEALAWMSTHFSPGLQARAVPQK
jgi:hypothetical protein